MADLQTIAATIYVAGVMIGLARVDARPAVRVGLALCWPLGPVTFILTLVFLLVASVIAFPLYGALALLAAGGVLWITW